MSTSQDIDEIVATFGMILHANIAPISAGLILYGVYIVLFAICVRLSLMHGLGSRASKFLFAAVIILFASTTIQCAGDLTYIVTQIKTYLMNTRNPIDERRHLWVIQHIVVTIVCEWPMLVNYIISDTIVVWRAWVLYPEARVVRIVLALLASADAVLWTYAISLESKHASHVSNPATDASLFTACTFTSFGTNFLGTACIAYKAWKHYAVTNKLLQKRSGDVTRVLLVLVETGALFAVVQLTVAIMYTLDMENFTKLDMATDIIGKSSIYLAAILPTATIIIVRSRQSLDVSMTAWEDSALRTPMSKTRISTIRFSDKRVPVKEETTLATINSFVSGREHAEYAEEDDSSLPERRRADMV